VIVVGSSVWIDFSKSFGSERESSEAASRSLYPAMNRFQSGVGIV